MAQFSHLGLVDVKIVSTAQALTNGVTAYSNPFKAKVWAGFAAVLISANTSTVTISQQCSIDNVNWYDPTDNAGNALGLVYTGFAATAQYIEFNPVLSKYVRFKYIPTVTGVITMDAIILE